MTLTPLELRIMKSVWRRGTARVRDVQSDLLPGRKLAYTTVMTVLDRLFRKGIVRRAKKSRAHVYESAISEAEFRSEAVRFLLDDYFGGSSRALRAFLDEQGGAGLVERTDRMAEREAARRPESGRLPIDESLL